MRLKKPVILLLLSLVALAGAAAVPSWLRTNVVYDPYWHDFHPWTYVEERRYQRWEVESNRLHLEFGERSPGDQLAYWDWWHGVLDDSARVISDF
jgi:hypothetical protein